MPTASLSCVVTDDEPIAAEILEDYVRAVPGLELVATCRNAVETGTILRTKSVDVLLIDIRMPGLSGLDFIRTLQAPPAVIFTTAYPNFAVDAFELDATDYLLKPVSFDRFLKAVNKVSAKHKAPIPTSEVQAKAGEQKFFFTKSSQGLVKVSFESILYLEGLQNYVKIHCENRVVVAFATMKNMEEALLRHRFLRIHRSYIVNLDKVENIRNYTFHLRVAEIAAGKSYRKAIADFLRDHYSVR